MSEKDSKNLSEECYKLVSETVRTVNTFPMGAARDMFGTYTSFHAVIDHLSDSVLAVANAVIQYQGIRTKLKKDSSSILQLSQINDEMLDRIHQSTSSLRDSSQTLADPVLSDRVNQGKIQYEKPQEKFNIVVDNSTALWKPPIVEKPNSISPLSFEQVQNEDGIIAGYHNPYRQEIWNSPLTKHWLSEKKIIYPQTKIFHYVETEEELRKMCEDIKGADAIAVDLEHHTQRSYLGLTCLLQIATETDDYIVDVLKLWGKLQCLNETFTNPQCVKVFHGAQNDVLWLQRDLGVYLVGLFDTHEAAKVLEMPQRKLADLVYHYCGVTLDKTFQMSDWSVRPLSAAQLKYATMDTHYLLYIWQRMLSDLLKKGDDTRNLINDVIWKGRNLCQKYYVKPMIREDDYKQLYKWRNSTLDSTQDLVLRKLFVWRDTVAREEDERPVFILPNNTLLSIAQSLPTDESTLTKCFGHRVTALMQKNFENILKTIQEAISESSTSSGPAHTTASAPESKAATKIAVERTERTELHVEHMDFPKQRTEHKRQRFQGHHKSSTDQPHELTSKLDFHTYLPPFQRHLLYKYMYENYITNLGSRRPNK